MTLEFRWTTSRARDTYGYNIVTLYVDGRKVSSCNGGGYDMQGTALADWIGREYAARLVTLKEPFYGLTFRDPKYNPGKAVVENGETVEQREAKGKSIGLERYQAFRSASNPLPTDRHTVPLIDGACGLSSVERIMKAIGLTLSYVPTRSKSLSIYTLAETAR